MFVKFDQGLVKDVRELRLFVCGETTEDEIDVAETLTEVGMIGAEAKSRKITSLESGSDGLEAVIATAATFETVASLTEV